MHLLIFLVFKPHGVQFLNIYTYIFRHLFIDSLFIDSFSCFKHKNNLLGLFKTRKVYSLKQVLIFDL